MVFFLSSVSQRRKRVARAVSFLLWKTLTLTFARQVIYKKFNIPCPLESEHHNVSFADDEHLHQHMDNSTDDFCEAKLFTVNSQVGVWSEQLSRLLVC